MDAESTPDDHPCPTRLKTRRGRNGEGQRGHRDGTRRGESSWKAATSPPHTARHADRG